MQLASLLPQLSETTVLIVGLVFGVIFALLAIFLQRFAIGIAGFLAGGFILTTLLARLGVESLSNWVVYIIGGMIGIMLVILLFDWALIIFSSLAGAALLLQSFSTQTPAGVLIFFLLSLVGIIIQGGPHAARAAQEKVGIYAWTSNGRSTGTRQFKCPAMNTSQLSPKKWMWPSSAAVIQG